MVRKHFKITGRVQGVGFRYRAKYAASGMGLTGWVRNEWDGSVEMEVQGENELINKLLVRINSGQYIYIDGIETKEIPLEPEERDFHVRYSW